MPLWITSNPDEDGKVEAGYTRKDIIILSNKGGMCCMKSAVPVGGKVSDMG
jgi:hypothetical protein